MSIKSIFSTSSVRQEIILMKFFLIFVVLSCSASGIINEKSLHYLSTLYSTTEMTNFNVNYATTTELPSKGASFINRKTTFVELCLVTFLVMEQTNLLNLFLS